MTYVSLDYTNCLAESIGATHGLTDQEIDTLVAKFPKHHETIEEIRSTGESAFFDLPYQDLTPLQELIKIHAGKWENVIVVGTAGAAIGPQTLLRVLLPEQWNLLSAEDRDGGPRVFTIDSADPTSLHNTLEVVDIKKTLFFVLSRTGNTAETNGLLIWLIDHLTKKSGKTSPSKQIVLATDPERSTLTSVAQDKKIATIDVPNNLSGRFSLLHVCSLFPAALCGCDIDALLKGAAEMDERCRHDRATENPAYMHSLIHYLLTRKRRKTIHATMAFSNRLVGLVDWYSHLLAVSLGKMLNKKGKAVHVGPSPAQCAGPAGSYGQMQLYQEGPFDKVTTFVTVEDHGSNFEVPSLYADDEQLNYLTGATSDQMLDQSYVGAAYTITSTGRPNMSIHLKGVDPRAIGNLSYMLMLSTVMSAELYGIDPFDQPGVDANKQAVFAQLGRAGFEDKAAALAEYRTRDVKTC